MKSLKKTLVLLLGAALVAFATACIAGCGGGQASSTASSSSASQAQQEAVGKTLVAYYSATGSTATVAQQIVEITGADTFAIMPTDPYTSADLDYNDPDSRVSREHADAAARDVALTQAVPDDWDSYDTIIIGYPIWWGEAAFPVDAFVKANDFTGKSVIPFCTSASSDMGNSAQQLEGLANGGEWLGGMRFPSGVAQDEVLLWIDDLGLEKQDLQ